MAVVKLYNLARMVVSSGGTSTLTLGAAAPGYLTFALAGVANGDTVRYGIIDGANSEIGSAVYTSSGTTLSSRTLLKSTTGGLLNVSVGAQVFICPAAEDFRQIYLDDGSVIAPSLTFLNDPTNGIYRIGSNHWGLAASGALVLDITPAGIAVNGYIGFSTGAAFAPNGGGVATVSNLTVFSCGSSGYQWNNTGNTAALMLLSNSGDLTAISAVTIFGPGGTGGVSSALHLDGGSASNNGSYIVYKKNSVAYWYTGTASAITGGTDNDYIIYGGTAGRSMLIFSSTGAVRCDLDLFVLCPGTNVHGLILQNVGGASHTFVLFQDNSDDLRGGWNGSDVFVINHTTGAYSPISDVSQKTDIVPIEPADALARMRKLGPASRHKTRGKKSLGFVIDDDTMKAFPELVTVNKDGLRMFNYAGLVAPLAAIVLDMADNHVRRRSIP